MKNKKPGWPLSGSEGEYYILGGDNLARDVFSRLVHGSRTVMKIAPTATLFAFMVGITLGLPAGYFTGRLDTFLSFLANLVLAFPVILLFYLLVTPEIRSTGIPHHFLRGSGANAALHTASKDVDLACDHSGFRFLGLLRSCL